MLRHRNCRATPLTSFLSDLNRCTLIKQNSHTSLEEELLCAKGADIPSPPSSGKQYSVLFALVVVHPTGMFSCLGVRLMTQVIRNIKHLVFVAWSNKHPL